MAMILIRQWHLAVLRVRLDLAEPTPTVASELSVYRDGARRPLWELRHPLGAFGLGAAPGPSQDDLRWGSALRVPADLVDAVRYEVSDDLDAEAALWLRLEPPYGHLGVVPWEAALADAVPLPLLRIPDRLPAAVDPGHAWTAAIAVCAPVDTRWAAPYVESLVGHLEGAGLGESLDVHLFVDAGTAAQLDTGRWPWVTLHPPEDAATVAERIEGGVPRLGGGTRLVSGAGRRWADWIVAGLGGRAARALHVVLDAAWDGDRPVLALSGDPATPVDRTGCDFVGGHGVRNLVDVIGAATLSFGSPPDNPADTATRMIADAAGQQRHGATLYASLRDDPEGVALADALGYLGGPPLPRTVPRHPALFTYVQPEVVLGSARASSPDYPEPDVLLGTSPGDTPDPHWYPDPPSALTEYYRTAQAVPSWVAASQRYIEAGRAELARDLSPPGEQFATKRAYEQGAGDALAEIEQLLARYVEPS